MKEKEIKLIIEFGETFNFDATIKDSKPILSVINLIKNRNLNHSEAIIIIRLYLNKPYITPRNSFDFRNLLNNINQI